MNNSQTKRGDSILSFNKEYITEFVYGGIDGVVTTFAVVAGAAGANADVVYVLIFGFANLIADGFSMSVGSFFSTKTQRENFEKHKAIAYRKVDYSNGSNAQEILEIYRSKGFSGQMLEDVVSVITNNRDVWVDTIMKEELEMIKDEKTPFRTGLATFLSFFFIGLIPLISYVLAMFINIRESYLFPISIIATSVGLILIGYLKSCVTEKNPWMAILETVLLGGLAAFLAYFVGEILGKYLL